MKTVYVFLAQGFEEIEAITIVDVLRRGGLNVVTISIVPDKKVKGAHEIKVMADEVFEKVDFTKGDMLVLPGGMPGASNLNNHDGVKKQIESYYAQNKYIAAICAAPLVLGQLGLLKGKPAVSYPGFEDQLIEADVKPNERVVVANNIITSKGPGTALEFSLKLVEILVNKNVSDQLTEAMIVK